MAMMNTLRSGKFSSDRTIQEYAQDIWQLKSLEIPNPQQHPDDRIKFTG